MAFRVVTSRLLRHATRVSSGRRNMSEMAFTFAAPNGVHYDSAAVKQVILNQMYLTDMSVQF